MSNLVTTYMDSLVNRLLQLYYCFDSDKLKSMNLILAYLNPRYKSFLQLVKAVIFAIKYNSPKLHPIKFRHPLFWKISRFICNINVLAVKFHQIWFHISGKSFLLFHRCPVSVINL